MSPSAEPCERAVDGIERIGLGGDRMLVRTRWGGWVEAPTFNIDVAAGVIRDGIIEPWTTRLVQELLRPGHCYFNAGANFGYYVALGGQIVGEKGKILAAEPNPHILPYLVRTIYWSGIVGRTQVFDVALGGNNAESADFIFDPQYLGGGSLSEFGATDGSHEVSSLAEALWSAETIRNAFDADHAFSPLRQTTAPFKAAVRTIDTLCGETALDLLHLDVEGCEAMALTGAHRTLARSPGARIVTEWSAGHYQEGSDAARRAFDDAWGFLGGMGFRVRRLEPRLGDNGGIFVSAPLDYEFMTQTAPHGDYVWLRPQHDPW